MFGHVTAASLPKIPCGKPSGFCCNQSLMLLYTVHNPKQAASGLGFTIEGITKQVCRKLGKWMRSSGSGTDLSSSQCYQLCLQSTSYSTYSPHASHQVSTFLVYRKAGCLEASTAPQCDPPQPCIKTQVCLYTPPQMQCCNAPIVSCFS